MIDSSSIRVHQHAANVKGDPQAPRGTPLGRDAWALARLAATSNQR